MTAYVDSSVVLRLVLGQRGALAEWRTVRRGVASALVEVECLRTLDRLRVREGLDDATLAERRSAVFALLEAVDVVEPTRAVLARAAQPLPTELGTLDAIHLATAMVWQEREAPDLVMATHDVPLATAARALGLRVVGVGSRL
jgi:predicted nucleic acid-binding protein